MRASFESPDIIFVTFISSRPQPAIHRMLSAMRSRKAAIVLAELRQHHTAIRTIKHPPTNKHTQVRRATGRLPIYDKYG